MGLRFRQSFTLFPGVRLNVGKRGVSASFGVPGATANLSARGLRATVGIPGSGLSYTGMLAPAGRAGLVGAPIQWQPPPELAPQSVKTPATDPTAYVRAPGMREIGSAAVESLTSTGLLQVRAMIVDIRRQRREIEEDLSDARSEHLIRAKELNRRKKSLFRLFFKKRVTELDDTVSKLSAEIGRLGSWLEATHAEVQFDADDAAQRAYGSLVRAYDALCRCTSVWDVTGDRDTNRVVERTSASRAVERRRVALGYSKSDIIRFNGQAMRFANANGEDILIYPGMILMQRQDDAFALLDLRDVQVSCEVVEFIEDEQVPYDSEVVRHTWAKTNKDGTPDRRFRDNYQIPICRYGRIKFTSPTGLTEEYQFSSASAALAFNQPFEDYKVALRDSGNQFDP